MLSFFLHTQFSNFLLFPFFTIYGSIGDSDSNREESTNCERLTDPIQMETIDTDGKESITGTSTSDRQNKSNRSDKENESKRKKKNGDERTKHGSNGIKDSKVQKSRSMKKENDQNDDQKNDHPSSSTVIDANDSAKTNAKKNKDSTVTNDSTQSTYPYQWIY